MGNVLCWEKYAVLGRRCKQKMEDKGGPNQWSLVQKDLAFLEESSALSEEERKKIFEEKAQRLGTAPRRLSAYAVN
jgi:hypothetical protein